MVRPELLITNPYNPLHKHTTERYLPSAYNDNMTQLEKINYTIRQLNRLGELSNLVTDHLNEMVEWVTGDGITESVDKRLESWKIDGTLDSIINVTLFEQLNGLIAKLESDKANASLVADIEEVVDSLTLLKANKSDVEKLQDEKADLSLIYYLTPENFDAKGDGTTNDTKAWLEVVEFWKNNGFPKIIAKGKYYIDDSILFEVTNKYPIIEGSGRNVSQFIYPTLAPNKSALLVQGNSGQANQGYIKDFGFVGNDYSVGIEIRDCVGFSPIACRFERDRVGVLWHNFRDQGYTEYCPAIDCDFSYFCHTAIEYKQSNGVESFHGCGLKGNNTINQDSTENNYKIIINDGCRPYNAPLQFAIWLTKDIPVIKNSSNKAVHFFGDIKIECFGTGYLTEIVDSNFDPVHFVGGITQLDQKCTLGKLILCDRVQFNVDGSINAQRKPYQQIFNLTTGNNRLIQLQNNESAFVTATIVGDNYGYTNTFMVYGNPFNGSVGSVIPLSQTPQDSNNASGWGDPTFTYDNGYFTIGNNNFPLNGVKAYVSVNPQSSRYQYYLNSEKV